MIIAVPAVSKFILKSNKGVYAADVNAYVETVRGKYSMKEYGDLLMDDEIMVVPLGHVVLEKGNSSSSPYGEYDLERSHILIIPEREKYSYYATVIDSEKIGMVKVPENQIGEETVEENIETKIDPLSTYDNPLSVYYIDGRAYKRSDVREIEGEDVNEGYTVYVFKDTGITGIIKVLQLFSFGAGLNIVDGTLEHYYDSWRLNGDPVTSVTKPTKVGYTFEGYYTGMNGTGTMTIDRTGKIVEGIEENLGGYTAAFSDFSANPLIFGETTSETTKSIVFSPSSQTITINGALNGTGNYQYSEISEKKAGGSSTDYFDLSGTTITVKGNTPVDTYTYVVKAKDTVSGSEKEATYTITVTKAESSITCTDRTYNGSAQNMYTANNGCTPSTNSSVTNATDSSFTVLCAGDSNHNDSTCTAKMNKQVCNAPTSVAISTAGVVTWTASSNCSTHQISIDNSSWAEATSGVDYKSTIIATTGSRTVYVRAIAPNSNYITSDNGTESTTVYSVTLSKVTGISSVSGAGNYIAGETVTIDATLATHYNWENWSGTPNTTTKNYSATIDSDWDATANAGFNCENPVDTPSCGDYGACSVTYKQQSGKKKKTCKHMYYSREDTSYLCSEGTTYEEEADCVGTEDACASTTTSVSTGSCDGTCRGSTGTTTRTTKKISTLLSNYVCSSSSTTVSCSGTGVYCWSYMADFSYTPSCMVSECPNLCNRTAYATGWRCSVDPWYRADSWSGRYCLCFFEP